MRKLVLANMVITSTLLIYAPFALTFAGIPAEAKSTAGFTRISGGILNPAQFRGYVRQAYAAAAANQGTASKIFCYCGCDKEAGHKNLKDCFCGDHGTYCSTCKNEMMRSAGYAHEGLPIAQIRHKIDYEFSESYPYKYPSAALRAYHDSEQGIAAQSSNRM